MDSVWSFVLQSLGVTAVVIAAVTWIARTVVLEGLRREGLRIQEQLRRDTDAALEDIRHRATRDLEAYRHTLDLRLADHGVRFEKLHERRFQLIASLYAAVEAPLRTASVRAWDHRRWIETRDEEEVAGKVKRLKELQEHAYKVLAEARLYLPTELDNRIRTLLASIDHPLMQAFLLVLGRDMEMERKAAGVSHDDKPLDIEGVEKAFAQFPNSTAALADLANECRLLLGVPMLLSVQQHDAG